MAHIEPLGVETLEKMFTGLKTLGADIDVVAQKCLDDASPAGEKAYKGALRGAVSAGLPSNVATATHTLPAQKNFLGDFSVSRPVGFYPPTGARYGMLAAIWNYGTKNGKVPATHWHDQAVAAAEGPVTKIVMESLSKQIDKLIG